MSESRGWSPTRMKDRCEGSGRMVGAYARTGTQARYSHCAECHRTFRAGFVFGHDMTILPQHNRTAPKKRRVSRI